MWPTIMDRKRGRRLGETRQDTFLIDSSKKYAKTTSTFSHCYNTFLNVLTKEKKCLILSSNSRNKMPSIRGKKNRA